MVVKNDEKHDYKSTKRPVSTAFRTLYSQMHCLITLHETFNDLMLGVTKHRTGRTGPKYRSLLCKKGRNQRVAI